MEKGKSRISINLITKKVKSLLPLKDKIIYPAYEISIIDYTLAKKIILMNQNIIWELRWEEHNNPLHDSEPAKH